MVLGCLIFPAILYRRWMLATVFAISTVFNLFSIRDVFHAQTSNESSSGQSLTLASFNAGRSHGPFSSFGSFLDAHVPDVIVLLECSVPFLDWLESLDKYQVFDSSDNVVLVVRVEIAQQVIEGSEHLVLPGKTLVRSDCWLDGRRFSLVGIHMSAPVSLPGFRRRSQQYALLLELCKQEVLPVVLVGDFNSTPWSTPMVELSQGAGLIPGTRGRGYHGTWPSFCGRAITRLIGLPIDNCMVDEKFAITKFDVGPKLFSDHLPILVEIQWSARRD